MSEPTLVQQLESLYVLQNVDIRSVRSIQIGRGNSIRKSVSENYSAKDLQLEFDFGPQFRNWIAPAFPGEPIEYLGLSKQTERLLHASDKRSISDLLSYFKQNTLRIAGLGQGHWDEIRSKLEEYVDGRNTDKTNVVPFHSWIRILTNSTTDRIKLYLCLMPHELQFLSRLSTLEMMELRRYNQENCRNLREEGLKILRHPDQVKLIKNWLSDTCEAFVKPWISQRGGIIDREELLERLELVSESPEHSSNCLQFFEEVYGDIGKLMLLEEAAPGIYCDMSFRKELFHRVFTCARSYFFRPVDSYLLKELSTLIARELTKGWVEFTADFVLKTIKCCRDFELYRTAKGVAVRKASSRIKQAMQDWQGAPSALGS